MTENGMADLWGKAGGAKRSVSVLLPLALPGPYDYLLPEDLEAEVGACVVVPLGPRRLVGVVWGTAVGDVPAAKLKPVEAVLDVPMLPKDLRKLIDWVAAYTISPPGAVLRMAMRAPSVFEPEKPRYAYRATGIMPPRMTAARERVLMAASDGLVRSVRQLAEEAGCSDGVVRGLIDAGSLEAVEIATRAAPARLDPARASIALNPEQAEAAEPLIDDVVSERFQVSLLDGITGSGKTEVYFEAIAAALRAGGQVLVLLPEIALTAQFLARFEDRFGGQPLAWHSDLKTTERARVWKLVAEGEGEVVVGARSALFLPFSNLKLIVVDEEHDPAFKQEDGVCYHARDMSVVRGQIGGFPVILSSATPALETLVNAQSGRYRHLRLPQRHGAADLPATRLIDLRRTPPERGTFLSPPLIDAVEGALERGEQAMLFLNRRGYAPLTLCRACGHRLDCPNCSSWLVEHRFRRELQCHHCGYMRPVPVNCPSCGEEDSLVPCGPGVERIAEEVALRFPEARLSILASDNLHGPAAFAEAVRAIEAREIDLIIGTQMIAKGHHFPDLTVVGVVDADLSLENGDLRAGERTFQLLHQVGGRAGRGHKAGEVLIQTHMPEHPVMQALAAQDRDRFMEREAEQRKAAGLPPFGRLVGIVLSSPDAVMANKCAEELARRAPHSEEVRVLGPAPAPLALLRGRTRIRFLVKGTRRAAIQDYVRDWLNAAKMPNSVRIGIDVDPQSFM